MDIDLITTPSKADNPRKRKSQGRKREIDRDARHSNHVTGPDCRCKRHQCFRVVDETNRARIISEFNNMSSKDTQDAYLSGIMVVSPVKRHRPCTEMNVALLKENTIRFYVRTFAGKLELSVASMYSWYRCWLCKIEYNII